MCTLVSFPMRNHNLLNIILIYLLFPNNIRVNKSFLEIIQFINVSGFDI